MTHTLVIPNYGPPTLNSTMRGTIKDRCRIGKECKQFVRSYALQQGIPRARSARRVTIAVVFPPDRRRPDPDAVLKVMLDALVTAKLIVDDTYEYCLFMPPVYYIGERLETRIELTDIPVRTVERIE